MGDFFSALPGGGSPIMLWLSLFCINTFLLEESIEMEFVVDGTHPWQLCRSCDFTAQG